MTIRESILRRLGSGSDQDIISEVARELNVKKESVARKFRSVSKPQPNQITKPSGRSLAEFKQSYDKNTYVPQKIQSALNDLGDAWEYEMEFIKRSGVSLVDINIFREMFSRNFVHLKRENKRIWCGTESFANKIRELI